MVPIVRATKRAKIKAGLPVKIHIAPYNARFPKKAMMLASHKLFQWITILTGMLLVFLPTIAAAPLPHLVGNVVGVHDGDTLTLLTADKVQIKVRLEGIDAPESKQPFGTRSKEALSALVFGKTATIRQMGQDRYRRTLGRVFVEGRDVNLAMVQSGLAWRYVKYSGDPALIAAEQEARVARRGLWADPQPVPPWEWRKRK